MSDLPRFAVRSSTATTQSPEGLTATVPRQLVHRASLAETFLTGVTREGPDRFTVFAEWPRAHQLYVSPDRSAYEPLLVVETARQAGTLLAHLAYEVPLGHQFVLKDLRLRALPERLAVGATPAEPTLHINVIAVDHRGSRPAGFRYEAQTRRNGELVATAELAATWISPAAYRRLRGGRTAATVSPLPTPPGLPPALVRRSLPADVVLAPSDRPGRWLLRVDPTHAVFFDHPLDHVPGMLLLEAARQALCARLPERRRAPVSFRAAFHRYAELDLPVRIEAFDTSGASGTSVQVLGRQGESTVFECEVGAADG